MKNRCSLGSQSSAIGSSPTIQPNNRGDCNMVDDGFRSALPDSDEEETEEWRESILSVEENLSLIHI